MKAILGPVYQGVMASKVEPPFVLLPKTKGGSTPRPNSFLRLQYNVGFAARLVAHIHWEIQLLIFFRVAWAWGAAWCP
jgi:hypothetical protein